MVRNHKRVGRSSIRRPGFEGKNSNTLADGSTKVRLVVSYIRRRLLFFYGFFCRMFQGKEIQMREEFQSEERKQQRILHLIGTRLFPNLNTNLPLLPPLRKMLGEKVNSW